MWFVGCEAPGCTASTDGFTAMDEEGKTWFRDPNRAVPSRVSEGWLCLKHKPGNVVHLDEHVTVDPVANNVAAIGNVWVGETLPDPEIYAEMLATTEQRSAFVSAAPPPDRGTVLPFAHNMMRPRSKPRFQKLPDPEYPELEHALDSLEEDPKLRKAIDEAFEAMFATDSVQDEFGFNDVEDGSQERYRKRKTVVPWSKHTAWWLVHNCLAHPLIGVLPVRMAFQFHDWTSRKMHGR